MIYTLYFISFSVFVALVMGKSFVVNLYKILNFVFNNKIAAHFVVMLGKILFNLGIGFLLFSITGILASGLGYDILDIKSLFIYGLVTVVSGYIAETIGKKNLKELEEFNYIEFNRKVPKKKEKNLIKKRKKEKKNKK